jgi:hypothetical protein
MGVLYTVLPLEPKVLAWLKNLGVELPSGSAVSRNPTPAELRAAVTALPGYQAEITEAELGGTWQAWVESTREPEEGPWTLVNVLDYQGEHVQREFGFEKGWDTLIVSIVSRVAECCGPLVLLPDTGDRPIVVTSETVPDEAVKVWEIASGSENGHAI